MHRFTVRVAAVLLLSGGGLLGIASAIVGDWFGIWAYPPLAVYGLWLFRKSFRRENPVDILITVNQAGTVGKIVGFVLVVVGYWFGLSAVFFTEPSWPYAPAFWLLSVVGLIIMHRKTTIALDHARGSATVTRLYLPHYEFLRRRRVFSRAQTAAAIPIIEERTDSEGDLITSHVVRINSGVDGQFDIAVGSIDEQAELVTRLTTFGGLRGSPPPPVLEAEGIPVDVRSIRRRKPDSGHEDIDAGTFVFHVRADSDWSIVISKRSRTGWLPVTSFKGHGGNTDHGPINIDNEWGFEWESKGRLFELSLIDAAKTTDEQESFESNFVSRATSD